MQDFDFNSFSWHSALMPDENMINNKKIRHLQASDENLQSFSF